MKHSRQRQHKMWTKEEFKTVMTLWSSKSTQEIADELGRKTHGISSIAQLLRKAGLDLPKKHRNGYLNNLIEEFKVDLKKRK